MESFDSRVDKVFGSLQVTTSSSWRLSHDETRQQSLHNKQQLDHDYEDPAEQDEDADGESPCWAARSPTGLRSFEGMEVEDDLDGEGRAMLQMVGLDSTLDYEDEEDEFDKAAFGLDGSEEERLYMKGIQQTNRDPNPSKSLPLSLYDLKKLHRDPRANHLAARARLEEDAKDATSSCSTMASMETVDTPKNFGEDATDENENVTGVKRSIESIPASPEAPDTTSGESLKPLKRVRFALDPQQEENLKRVSNTQQMRHKINSAQASQVPDYVRNPTKYTRYTLDWSEEDNDLSNFEAFKACNEPLQKKIEHEQVEFPEDKMQKILFIQRHDRTLGNPQSVSTEETNQSGIAPSRMIRVEHLEGEFDNLDEEFVTPKVVNVVAGLQKATEKTPVKAAKNYRLRKDINDQMEV